MRTSRTEYDGEMQSKNHSNEKTYLQIIKLKNNRKHTEAAIRTYSLI